MRLQTSLTLFPYTTLFRSLQDARREDHLVHRRVIVGVHRRGRHEPLAAVEGLADLAQVAVEVEGRGAGGVLVERAARSEEHTSELQSQFHLVCRLLPEIKN